MVNRLFLAAGLVALGAWASTASAQIVIRVGSGYSGGYGGGYSGAYGGGYGGAYGGGYGGGYVQQPHIDHQDHVVHDAHGNVAGVVHQDVVHAGNVRIPVRSYYQGNVPSTSSYSYSGGGYVQQQPHVHHDDHVVHDQWGNAVAVHQHNTVHTGGHVYQGQPYQSQPYNSGYRGYGVQRQVITYPSQPTGGIIYHNGHHH